MRLIVPAFAEFSTSGDVVRAGGGKGWDTAMSEAVADGLAGLEALVGHPGTIGGA